MRYPNTSHWLIERLVFLWPVHADVVLGCTAPQGHCNIVVPIGSITLLRVFVLVFLLRRNGGFVLSYTLVYSPLSQIMSNFVNTQASRHERILTVTGKSTTQYCDNDLERTFHVHVHCIWTGGTRVQSLNHHQITQELQATTVVAAREVTSPAETGARCCPHPLQHMHVLFSQATALLRLGNNRLHACTPHQSTRSRAKRRSPPLIPCYSQFCHDPPTDPDSQQILILMAQ